MKTQQQNFIEKATNKINSTIFEPIETIEKIEFEEQECYNHYWITIYCKQTVFVDNLNELSKYFNDPMISIAAIDELITIRIYAAIK